jgi:hypothetical protein
MKSLSEQLQNFDRENFRRVAHNLPEVQDAREPVREAQQVAEVFNGLFAQLRAAFPAAIATIRTQAELTSSAVSGCWRWENGITTMEQVAAGMRVARQQAKPFLPSPGSLSPGAAPKRAPLSACRTPLSWSTWFISTAAHAGSTRTLNPTLAESRNLLDGHHAVPGDALCWSQ